jgi:hypothetical protein
LAPYQISVRWNARDPLVKWTPGYLPLLGKRM